MRALHERGVGKVEMQFLANKSLYLSDGSHTLALDWRQIQ